MYKIAAFTLSNSLNTVIHMNKSYPIVTKNYVQKMLHVYSLSVLTCVIPSASLLVTICRSGPISHLGTRN